MTGNMNIEYPRRERAPMRSWTQEQRGVLKPVRGEGDTKACLSFQRPCCHARVVGVLWQSSEVAWHACGMSNVLSCLMVFPSVGHIVVVAAAVNAEAVARARAVVREGGSAWGGLCRDGICHLAGGSGKVISTAGGVRRDVGISGGFSCDDSSGGRGLIILCGSEMAVGRYEMAAWSGSRGMGGKCEVVGISIGVMAEMDGVGATMEGMVVDREGTAVGNMGIGVETDEWQGCDQGCNSDNGDTQGMGAGRAEMGGVRVAVDVVEETGACTDVGMDMTGSETAAVGEMGSMTAGGTKAKATGGGA
ncbi:hypothetical protein F5148DRAFT_1151582 [Russula earlei]|uniref:Uncharacterized protein n=1 Tax=Russula earlei TaxID=71964 RepID=A0ACC0U1X3_9AGAM|nr:hypothetical protein F5148DRAFT_1151582 [Russula earlei]